MRKWLRAALPAAVLVSLGIGAPAQAATGYGGWSHCDEVWGTFDAWTYIDRAPNRINIFPYAGFTRYEGTPGTDTPSSSDYSHINYHVTPTAAAQSVLARLKALGIPLVTPDTQFLGKNPRAADNVTLPRPKDRPKKDDKNDEN